MVTPAAGSVVLVPFPFSDLSRAKLRPAVVLADAGRGDWILCQVTSKPYADPAAVLLRNVDFSTGSLQLAAMPGPGHCSPLIKACSRPKPGGSSPIPATG